MSQPDNEGPYSQPKDEMPAPVDAVPGRHSQLSIRKKQRGVWGLIALGIYLVGLGSGYLVWGRTLPGSGSNTTKANADLDALFEEVNPSAGVELPVRYGGFAPELIAAGVIDYAQFVKLYQEIGAPLSEQQIAILKEGIDAPVIMSKENQHFLLNLFWALGLVNKNKILTEGPMMRKGRNQVVNYASTGGWTLASKPVSELYASLPILALTSEQQERLEEVAAGVYRPCCDNPTHFPDCNHGMAMLGLLELMASQGASVDEMFAAAKTVNAFWFPQQALEVAVLFKETENVEFSQAEARQVVGQPLFSGSGFQVVHQWLAQNGKLGQVPEGGGSCGVK